MCGIAGALVYDTTAARLDRLIAAVNASAARGEDSFGVVRWSPSTGFRRHALLHRNGDDWLAVVGGPEATEPTVYLHTSRAEPTTEWVHDKTNDDIPPFISHGIAVAHNGIVANDGELAAEYRLQRRSAIDTAVIPPLVARLGIWRTIAALKGGAALAILDSRDGTLVVCRNFMPLAIAWEPGIISFASEESFFPGAGSPFPPFRLWGMPPYTALQLSECGFNGPLDWGDEPDSQNEAKWQPYPQLRWSC